MPVGVTTLEEIKTGVARTRTGVQKIYGVFQLRCRKRLHLDNRYGVTPDLSGVPGMPVQ